MEPKDNLFAKIQELLGEQEGNFSILEQQVDIDIQLKYFEISRELKSTLNNDDTFDKKELLFSDEVPLEEKKKILVHLASIDKVEAYRAIEKYSQNPDAELKDWSIMAFQESKMLMESSLLEQNQVFISTGLGGKQSKLRYFVVFVTHNSSNLEDYQKKVIKSELEFVSRKNLCEVEDLTFAGRYATFKILIPIQAQFTDMLEEGLDACNQFGNFLNKNFIVTNVKELSVPEIDDLLRSSDQREALDEQGNA